MLSLRTIKEYFKRRKLQSDIKVFHNMRQYGTERVLLGLSLVTRLPVSMEGKIAVRTATLAVLVNRLKHYNDDLNYIAARTVPTPKPLPDHLSTGSDYGRTVWRDVFFSGTSPALQFGSIANMLSEVDDKLSTADDDVRAHYRSRVDTIVSHLGQLLDQLI